MLYPEELKDRAMAAKVLQSRLDEISNAIEDASNGDYRAIRQFIDGRGRLVIGMESRVDDLMVGYETPLAKQPANEDEFARQSAKSLERMAS